MTGLKASVLWLVVWTAGLLLVSSQYHGPGVKKPQETKECRP